MSGSWATVSPGRRVHILDGDRTGGGHRAGTGISGKSEFPASWSDNKIISEIESVANNASSIRRPGARGRTLVSGIRDGVAILVVPGADNSFIITGQPIDAPLNR